MAEPVLSTVICVFFFIGSGLADLPVGWKACSKSSSQYEQCLIQAVEGAIRLLDQTKPSDVPPITPLKIPHVKIGKGKGPVSIDLEFRNVEIYGAKDISFQSIKNDWKKFEGMFTIPKINSNGQYKLNGNVLQLPISGEGKSAFNFENLKGKVDIYFKEQKRKGKRYFTVEKTTLDLQPTKLSLHLDNLFKGDKTLGENMNNFLNQNWEVLWQELEPVLELAVAGLIKQTSNRVFSKFPADDVDLK